MKGRWVFLIPFVLSFVLSLLTVGTSVGWQDSGFFLSAVKEMGILHPPGFVLYLLLSKAWTVLFFFLDFTLRVHLFSSACAAAAVGTLALSARELLASRGPLFQIVGDDRHADVAAVGAACLAASGYTFWAAAILAKGYALFYLVLSLLLWRMIRAHESRRGRDFTIVAALIGLAWAAHPSALLTGLALVLYVCCHARSIGWKGVAGRALLAAACAIAPSLLLPVLAARDPVTKFGDPTTLAEFLRYLRGARFTDQPDVFGIAPSRWVSSAQFFWEEFLGVGALAVVAGFVRIAITNRRLLGGIAAWVVPVVAVATLFKIEGQLDFWLVAAWLPLDLAVAVGLVELARRMGARAAMAAAAAGVLWAGALNGPLLSERGNDLPAAMGRLFLKNVEPNAVVVLDSDDALATASYLQVVKGERPDVRIVSAARPREFPGRPLYYENPPQGSSGLVPAGTMMKVARAVDPREWDSFPEMSRVYARARRARGQRVDTFEPERYERRLMMALVRAARQLALWEIEAGDLRRGAELLESIYAEDPESRGRLEIAYPLGAAQYQLGNYARAEPLLRFSLGLSPPPRMKAGAAYYLSVILGKRGDREEADRFHAQAVLALRGDRSLLSEFERSAGPK